MDHLILLFTSALVITAAWRDLATGRIPNRLTAGGLALGLVINTALAGPSGLGRSVLGLLTGLALLSVFYGLGGMGAGDVKLLSAVGALVGPRQVYYAFIVTALVGGLMALAWILARSAARAGGGNSFPVRSWIRPWVVEGKIPYAAPVGIGALLSFWIV